MPTYKKQETKTAQTGSKWNDNIHGDMTVHINTFNKGKKNEITKYSTRLYRKMKDSEEYINHFINVAFIGEEKPVSQEKSVKINVKSAFMSLDYYTNSQTGEIVYNPTIYIKEWDFAK